MMDLLKIEQQVNPHFGLVSLSKPDNWQIFRLFEGYRLESKPMYKMPISKRRFSKLKGICILKILQRKHKTRKRKTDQGYTP